MTSEETQEWLSGRYGYQLAEVFPLSSGRFVLSFGHEIYRECDEFTLIRALRDFAARPEPNPYVPPRQSKPAAFRLESNKLMDIKLDF